MIWPGANFARTTAAFCRRADGPQSRIIATARDALSPDDYRKRIRAELLPAIEGDETARKALDGFLQRVDYRLDVTRRRLGELAAALDGRRSASAFSTSRPARTFSPASASGACRRQGGSSRVVIENRSSTCAARSRSTTQSGAHSTNARPSHRHIWQGDGAEPPALRFGNALFEPLWKAEHIDHVQITVAETIGVGQRAGYYDNAGALRDMVQNHMLQLLCLVAMEPPASLEPDAVRDEKLKVLRALWPIDAQNAAHLSVRGQYRAGRPTGVPCRVTSKKPASRTRVPKRSWRSSRGAQLALVGRAVYLRTGKRLTQRVSNRRDIPCDPHSIFAGSSGQSHRTSWFRCSGRRCLAVAHELVPGPGGLRLRQVPLDATFASAFGGHQRGLRTPVDGCRARQSDVVHAP